MPRTRFNISARVIATSIAAATALAGPAVAQGPPDPPKPPVAAGPKAEYPPFDAVTKGLTKVISTADGAAPFYELYQDKKTGKLIAVLPATYSKQLFMIACTVSGGDPQAGVMGPTHFVKWRKINKKLALVAPNLTVRTDGDREARTSIEQLYTGRVLLSLPIVTMKGSRPVVDLGTMCLTQVRNFFGPSIFGGYGASVSALDPRLASLTKAKAFPDNIIVEYEAPRPDGQFVKLTYSIGKVEGSKGYKPRKADPRVGYFYNYHQDFARPADADITDRYITRWHIEKADPSLKMSPPREPLVWYIEHTTPIKFRRYVREGLAMWNQAFEKVGIVGAVEVYQQDAVTGAHMDKDPEDARYNFFRWNASDQSYAIGPSRAHPTTGEILDADIVWHQGLTRAVRGMLENLSDELVAQTFSPDTLAFLDKHPNWDPRLRLAAAPVREQRMLKLAVAAEQAASEKLESRRHPWTMGLNDPTNSACRIGNMLSMEMSTIDAALAAGFISTDGDLLDGLPEEYLGPMIRYISAHEAGHCIGLQHNMAASTINTLEELNSKGFEGATIASVMDYAAANINHELGEVQGPYATPELGPYDLWAIRFGYGPASEVEKVLTEVSNPDHVYVSQMAMMTGSDPRNMTWDLGANNLNFAESRLSLADDLRDRLIEDLVKDGESWRTARVRFNQLMGTRLQAIFMAGPWIGGSYINNDFKGDPGNRSPIDDVAAADQRRALNLIIENTFHDDAYGLTPEIMRHMGLEYWFDPAAMDELMEDPAIDAHDMIGGIQATALTLIMNPATLRRVYDNEYRAQGSDDILTLSEVVNTVTGSIWNECGSDESEYSAASPMVSSFRRNLQREHVARLIDLALLDDVPSPSFRTISALATQELRRIDSLAEGVITKKSLDDYSAAHLADVRTRIGKALDAAYVQTR
ncbi:MAG: zinc-dependent metalloprotease [Planctomycetota bacterium]|jgi:hypothetical protein